MKKVAAIALATVSLVPFAAPSFAQDAPGNPDAEAAETTEASEIVVTGTLLRGVAPVGSSLISAGREQLESTASATSNELLSRIPQVTNLFGSDAGRRYGISVTQVQIARPNLRNISPDNASSSATLVLFNGHRVATAGVTQASIDPDLFPTSAIERVEVVTDGGSATYGADAVGGVINFITRKRFDGVKVDARYGFADSYWQFDANAIVGKDWGSGSAYVAYTFNKSSDLFGRDRDFIRNRSYGADGNLVTSVANPNGTIAANPDGLRDQTCATPNFRVGSGASTRTFTGTNGTFVPNVTTFCDVSDYAAQIPEVERHGVFASLTQELSDWLSVDLGAFYSKRTTRARGQFTGSSVSITSSNFYYTQIPGTTAGATQSVNLSFAPALGGDQLISGTDISEWGAKAEFKANLTENWQLRTLFNYSQSNSSLFLNSPLASALTAAGAGATAATALNPYNLTATNAQLLQAIIDNQEGRQTRDHLLDLRAIVDGRLFTLPGGDVRVAIGYEYMNDYTQNRIVQNRPRGALSGVAFKDYRRNVHAVFGEVQIPIFGDDNAMPGIRSLVFSAQGRYDRYSDFGSTFNPKLGLNYKPVDWLTLRGNWSTSFNAPSTLDQLGATASLTVSTGSALTLFSLENSATTADLNARGAAIVAIQGSQSPLKPQTAETWSAGFDVEPPIVPGLRASLSYYNVKFNGILKTPSPFNSGIFAAYPNITRASANGFSQGEVTNFLVADPGLASDTRLAPLFNCGANCLANGSLVYALLDFRVGNYTNLRTSGLDFSLSYRRPTGFGSVDAAFSGNLRLTRDEQLNVSQPFQAQEGPDLLMQAVIGANIGDHVRAQGTWRHVSGYTRVPTTAWPQSHLDAFNAFDLFLKYDVKGGGWKSDLSLTFNVNNVFNAAPPFSKGNGVSGFENGSAPLIGRQFFFGISKQF
jgi:iron complex outermembrane receptor protein